MNVAGTGPVESIFSEVWSGREKTNLSLSSMFETENLKKIANMKMPFGKYKGRCLIGLPEPYLVWFAREGFPDNKLGELLQLTLEIKINGLEKLIYPLQENGVTQHEQ